jgi:hypothetical protein
VELPGGIVKAVFPGQEYDIPDDVAEAGISGGLLTKAEEPVSDKAVHPEEVSNKTVNRGRRAR